jgi:hypothetical protein
MSQSSWLVAGMLPGIERHPRNKLEPSPERLLGLLHRWRDEAVRAGRTITRIAVAFEAGRDGFWLARWLEARGVEAHVIHASSVAVSREHRRAKTDRLDTELLKHGQYCPDIIVHHHHGRRAPASARMWKSYGLGIGACYMKMFLRGPKRVRLVRFVCYVHRRDKSPRGFIFWEAAGAARYAYVRASWALSGLGCRARS